MYGRHGRYLVSSQKLPPILLQHAQSLQLWLVKRTTTAIWSPQLREPSPDHTDGYKDQWDRKTKTRVWSLMRDFDRDGTDRTSYMVAILPAITPKFWAGFRSWGPKKGPAPPDRSRAQNLDRPLWPHGPSPRFAQIDEPLLHLFSLSLPHLDQSQEGCQSIEVKLEVMAKPALAGFLSGCKSKRLRLSPEGLLGQFSFFCTGNGDLIRSSTRSWTERRLSWRIATPGKGTKTVGTSFFFK